MRLKSNICWSVAIFMFWCAVACAADSTPDPTNSPAALKAMYRNKIKDPKATESELVSYTRSLGLMRDPAVADDLIQCYKSNNSEQVRASCMQALSRAGGEKAGEFLLSVLKTTQNKEMHFNVLNLLAEMQYAPALPETAYLLETPAQDDWQTQFIFGKMGDKAVPFLIEKLKDKNPAVRMMSIRMLGVWLVAPEAYQPLRNLYWTELDKDNRRWVLGALEYVSPDVDSIREFSKKVIAKEKDKEVATYAKETIDNIPTMSKKIEELKTKKKPSSAAFQTEFEKLFKSYGKDGSIQQLVNASTLADEPRLKQLRERVLQRNSDESFYDYTEINEAIVFNRFLKKVK